MNPYQRHAHHDALEFRGGQIVLLTRLRPGQVAIVLQLPAATAKHGYVENGTEHMHCALGQLASLFDTPPFRLEDVLGFPNGCLHLPREIRIAVGARRSHIPQLL